MQCVRDLLVWYNNLDVEPFLVALERQSAIYREKGIDMLKEGLSLPGLAVVWLFSVVERPLSIREAFNRQRGDELYRYREAIRQTRQVRLLDDHDSDLYSLYKENTVGGPSLVFHRYHRRGQTRIREKQFGDEAKLCGEVLGVDANALYLYCLQKDMPVGFPRRRFEANGFRIDKKKKFGKSAQGWLAWMEFNTGKRLETETTSGERRLGRHNLPVDGFCQDTNTVYQFNGCFWHGHGCTLDSSKDHAGKTAKQRREETLVKEQYLRHLGYKVNSIWECHWSKIVNQTPQIKLFLKAYNEVVFGKDEHLTMEQILDKIKAGTLYGFVECDIHVPDHLLDEFSEMPPIFKNVELDRSHLSDYMRRLAEAQGFLKRPQRCLIGSMKAEKMLFLTDLLRWYLSHGLVVTRIYQVVEYEKRPIFREFSDSVSNTRRAGDTDSSLKLLANTAKLIGNSLYGKTITDKTKHKNVSYTTDEHKASLNIRSNYFHSINPLDEGVYETISFKKRVSITKRLLLFHTPFVISYFFCSQF
jgi:G:T-mismatch repair DNA endonuclease (very short patch repair protein)